MVEKSSFRNTTNNRGYSLIELIVVISIVSVVVAVSGIGVAMMFSRDAEKAARAIDDEITEVRMMTMTKPVDVSMTIHGEADQNYILVEYGTENKKVQLNDDVVISYYNDSGVDVANKKTLSDSDIELSFKKKDGSLKSLSCNGTLYDSDIHYIVCEAKNKNALISLMSITGRHSISK